ncbi:Sorting nexin-15 [Toxocara canis]|uniref:Sorting nexin-15 n=1 Tax=Toxocara canis TaxID=6265 RepID=A0A0B2V0Q1_TOXCA|nr:Sorting nexin-15 [Toxocara canis]
MEGICVDLLSFFKAVPRNSIDMDVRCFSLWTRFRDLSHLWSQLSKIHQQLYLHGTFPTFAPAKFFGNSEPSVIAERIEATGRFLNFVLASEVLRKTRVLHQFFAAAEEVSSQIDSTPPLSSTNVASSSAAHILESESIERQEVGGEIEAETEVSPNTTTPYPRSDEFSEVSLMNTSSSTASASISGTLASSQSMSSSTTSCLFDFPDIHVQSAAASTADLSDQTVHSTVLSEYLYVPTQGDSSRPVTTSGAASVQHHSIIERILPKIFSPNANVAEQSSTAVLQANPPRREASFYSVVGVASFSGTFRSFSLYFCRVESTFGFSLWLFITPYKRPLRTCKGAADCSFDLSFALSDERITGVSGGFTHRSLCNP